MDVVIFWELAPALPPLVTPMLLPVGTDIIRTLLGNVIFVPVGVLPTWLRNFLPEFQPSKIIVTSFSILNSQ